MTAEDVSNDDIKKEIDVLKKCNHPNCVAYYGSCWDASDLWVSFLNKKKCLKCVFKDYNGILFTRFTLRCNGSE